MQTLSVVIPVYNERASVLRVLEAVERSDTGSVAKEMIVVDDGSTDGTRDALKQLEGTDRYRIAYHDQNRGKGAALKTGFLLATGDYVLTQDADFEYDPADYPALLAPVLAGEADIVFGSRNLKPNNIPFSAIYFYGGRLTTVAFNFIFGTAFTDIHTGYKLFPARLIPKLLDLPGNGFVFDAVELTYALAAAGRIREVPIRYRARARAEGKKLDWRDGFRCLAAMARIVFTDSAPLGRPFALASVGVAALLWMAVSLAIVPIGPPLLLGSLEEFLKGQIFSYYFTIFFGWVEFLRRSGALPYVAGALAASVLFFSIRGGRRVLLRWRFLRVVLPALALVSVAAIFFRLE